MKSFLIKKFSPFLISLIIATNSYASGLMVTPSRVELDEKNSTKEVKLINKSKETIIYRVSLQHLRMKSNGEYVEITPEEEASAPEKFADSLLRFSPRKITLKPNEVQTIRIASRRLSKAADGEYRSHILFREEPAADFAQANNIEAAASTTNNKISIVLKPLFGISIPVIINKGEVSAKASISNIEINNNRKDPSKKVLTAYLNRVGNKSLYGNISVKFRKNGSKNEQEIGILNAVSVFWPYDKRQIKINLNLPNGTLLSDGVLKMQYVARADAEDSGKVYAKSAKSIK